MDDLRAAAGGGPGVLRAEYPAAWLTRWDQTPGRPRGQLSAGEAAAVCGLIRDLFGPPSRPAGFDPAWRTSTAVALARQMYESRDLAAMPILADALQDAGCDDPDILAHCRGGGPHARGCWVVDLVLGKGSS